MFLKAAKFTLGFVLLLSLVYSIHTGIVSINPQVMRLVNFSYLFNFGFTYFFLINFILFQEKLMDFIGFLFMGISTVKLSVFVYLVKTSNFDLNKSVFFHFFIPLIVCVGVEIFYLLKELNTANFNNNN